MSLEGSGRRESEIERRRLFVLRSSFGIYLNKTAKLLKLYKY